MGDKPASVCCCVDVVLLQSSMARVAQLKLLAAGDEERPPGAWASLAGASECHHTECWLYIGLLVCEEAMILILHMSSVASHPDAANKISC